MRNSFKFFAAFLFCSLWFFADDVFAQQADYTIYLNGGDDVAYIGEVNTFEVWIANDVPLAGLSTPIEITFATAYNWDMGYGSHPPVNEEGRAVGAWDLGLGINQDFDNISPDHLSIYGISISTAYFPIGPSELCYSLQFYIPPGEPETADGISIIPTFIEPVQYWEFCPVTAECFRPTFGGQDITGPDDAPVAPPLTFDIIERPRVCGDVNCDGNTNVGDIVYIANWAFKGGPSPCSSCPF